MAVTDIKIQARSIKQMDEFDKFESAHRGKDVTEVCPNDGMANFSWRELWQARHDYAMAGISADGVLAVEGSIAVSGRYKISATNLARFTYMFLDEHFPYDGEQNILSCLGFSLGKGGSACHFLIYPLDGRQLLPDKWVSFRTGDMLDSLKEEYINGLIEQFSLDIETVGAKIDNGHTEYLDNFPLVLTSKEDIQEIEYKTITEENQVQTDYPRDRIQTIANQTIIAFTSGVSNGEFIKLNNGDITIRQYLMEAEKFIRKQNPDISDRDLELIMKKVNSSATGFYILDDLINDPAISDIKVLGPDKIRVKVKGQRRTSNLHFIDPNDYIRFLNGLMMRYHLSKNSQIHVFTDKTSNDGAILRNNITLWDINSGYPVYHIRKIPKKKYTVDDLVELGMMDRQVANYLIYMARYGRGMIFTGKGSSGKTTLMNALLEETPSNCSGSVIQESEELYSNKPELNFLHITDEYSLQDLCRNGLLTDIDYFIIGECKGPETAYFITACDTGNKAWCSVHAPNSREAIDKMVDYILSSPTNHYSRAEATKLLKNLQVVVYLQNFKVCEISEILGYSEEKQDLIYKPVLRNIHNNLNPGAE